MPSAAGNRAGSIAIADSVAGSPQTIALSGVGVAAPDFTVGQASGSQGSQTVTAGQNAQFSLAVTPAGSFTGTVSLSCGMTPAMTPTPTCSLSSSSVLVGGSGTQTVTVTAGTTAPVTAASHAHFPPGAMPLAWTAMLLGMGWLLPRNRKRLLFAAVPAMVLALASMVGCGGGGSSSSSHTTTGTPAGTFTVTITATSGSLTHNTTMTVVVR